MLCIFRDRNHCFPQQKKLLSGNLFICLSLLLIFLQFYQRCEPIKDVKMWTYKLLFPQRYWWVFRSRGFLKNENYSSLKLPSIFWQSKMDEIFCVNGNRKIIFPFSKTFFAPFIFSRTWTWLRNIIALTHCCLSSQSNITTHKKLCYGAFFYYAL